MASNRVNLRPTELIDQERTREVYSEGNREPPGGYTRSPIRRDMDGQTNQIFNAILEGIQDTLDGRFFKGTGAFKGDMATLAQLEASDWREKL